MYTIYKLTNNINGMGYVGFTSDLKRRLKEHKINPKYLNTYLYNAIKKYGWSNFSIDVLSEIVDKEEAKLVEIKLIEEHKTYHTKNGYNMTLGGDGSSGFENYWKGKNLSKEHRNKIGMSNRISLLGKKLTEKHKYNIGNAVSGSKHPNFGKKMKTEQKVLLSVAHKGKSVSVETKKNMSAGQKIRREREACLRKLNK